MAMPAAVALAALLLTASCGRGTVPATGPTEMDRAALLQALRAEGAAVQDRGSLTQPFLAGNGRTIAVDAEEVQTFEYASATAAAADAGRVAPDGGSVGGTMVSWIGPPHFFRRDRVLVLYVGSSASTLSLLQKVLGPQFAGQ